MKYKNRTLLYFNLVQPQEENIIYILQLAFVLLCLFVLWTLSGEIAEVRIGLHIVLPPGTKQSSCPSSWLPGVVYIRHNQHTYGDFLNLPYRLQISTSMGSFLFFCIKYGSPRYILLIFQFFKGEDMCATYVCWGRARFWCTF